MKLRTPQDIEKFGMGVKILKMRYDSWLQERAVEIVREEIIIPLHDAMRSHGYSDKIIEGTDIDRIMVVGKKVSIKIKSEYFAKNGFDVALAREVGTKPHWVEPLKYPTNLKTAKGTTSRTTGPDYQKLTGKQALHWKGSSGEDMFSKGHITGGIEARGLVKLITAQGRDKAVQRIREEFIAWRNDILNT